MIKDILALIGLFISVSLMVVGKDLKRRQLIMLGGVILLVTLFGWLWL
ncbi:hypothetical protein H9L19_03325 [Weissella diestrammenae]|uniref:Uncharacterized protein n=1 Tax=Weissella diestrammenae TaxID=1162633 RepID=A0A7G9T728_9LACO|nr:hypothetical protein [Weissella diestrammenae]MCM0582499.1 hypothetical protein [Weissella diestrammenae]QNN75903.1 hypothetical protein H9L19_03325 [Weissella diestrammenae]